MKRIRFLILAVLASCSFFNDDQDDALSNPLVAARKATIDSYEPAIGTWEGTFFITSAPDGLMESFTRNGTKEHGVRIRVELSNQDDPTVALRYPDENTWNPIQGPTKYFSNNLGWQVFIERSGGVWIEKFSITFDRVKEREAAITFTRTVHNWYLIEAEPNLVDFYHMFGAGRVSKVDDPTVIKQ